MTQYPCLKDTATVDLAVDAGGLLPTLNLDGPVNGLALDGSGLHVKPVPGLAHSTRICNVASQALPTASIAAFGTIRHNTTGNGVLSGNLYTTRAGLWSIGGIFTFSFAASIAQVWVQLGVQSGGVPSAIIATDSCGSKVAYSPQPTPCTGTVTCNPSGMIWLPAGASTQAYVFHNLGGNITLVGSSVPPTAVAGTCELAGCEMWATLIVPED